MAGGGVRIELEMILQFANFFQGERQQQQKIVIPHPALH
jgi:hypothetical protein